MPQKSLCELSPLPTSLTSRATHSLLLTDRQTDWPFLFLVTPGFFSTKGLGLGSSVLQTVCPPGLDMVILILLFKVLAQILSPEKGLSVALLPNSFSVLLAGFIFLIAFTFMCVW